MQQRIPADLAIGVASQEGRGPPLVELMALVEADGRRTGVGARRILIVGVLVIGAVQGHEGRRARQLVEGRLHEGPRLVEIVGGREDEDRALWKGTVAIPRGVVPILLGGLKRTHLLEADGTHQGRALPQADEARAAAATVTAHKDQLGVDHAMEI